jgi:hypothetical protein
MHTCPGYDEESEKSERRKKAEKGAAAAQKKHTNSLPQNTRNQINLKMMNRMRKRSNRDY